MNIQQTEIELKKRWSLPYKWGRRQSDAWDTETNFIYDVPLFDELLLEINKRFGNSAESEALSNYTLNRWYNFYSAMAIEEIFASHPKVQKVWNGRDREKDFFIDNIPFDHKTSVFPSNYDKSVAFARENPKDLAKWLYINQSSEQRFHIKNRLFVVLYCHKGEHWKLKAELVWLQKLIERYLNGFSEENLIQLTHKNGSLLTDILFAEK